MKGANIANYTEFQDFIKDANGKINGAVLFDKINKKKFEVKAKAVVNATGIHADELRKKDDPECIKRIAGARGTHLMFKRGLLPQNSGIIIPKTRDGRLIYVINYMDHALVGTTDEKCEITHQVGVPESDKEFIIDELKQVFGDDFDYKSNLVSTWSGIRPLVLQTDVDKAYQKEFTAPKGIFAPVKRSLRTGLVRLGKFIHGEQI